MSAAIPESQDVVPADDFPSTIVTCLVTKATYVLVNCNTQQLHMYILGVRKKRVH